MKIIITFDALVIMGILSILFLPYLYLLLICIIYTFIEEFRKLYAKMKFILDYILPIIALYLLWLILFNNHCFDCK